MLVDISKAAYLGRRARSMKKQHIRMGQPSLLTVRRDTEMETEEL